MLNGKKDQSEFLKGIVMEEQAFHLNMSFSLNSRSYIAVTKDLSLEEADQQTEQCPSIQLSVIDKLD